MVRIESIGCISYIPYMVSQEEIDSCTTPRGLTSDDVVVYLPNVDKIYNCTIFIDNISH